MAQLKQSEIIAEARIQAGRKGEVIPLANAFNYVIQDMSKRYPLLAKIASGTLTADQNYIALPSDYRSQRLLDTGGRYKRLHSAYKIGANWQSLVKNPVDFYYLTQTDYGVPMLYMVEASPAIKKIHHYPKCLTDTPAYLFYYYGIHEKAWPTWAGLAAKTDISFDAATKTIASAGSEFVVDACRVGREMTITGSVSNNSTFTIVSATTAAVVVAEAVVDEAAGAAVTVAVETEDDYLHLYGENWDPVVILGVAWRAARKIKEWDIAGELKAQYKDELATMGTTILYKPGQRVPGWYF